MRKRNAAWLIALAVIVVIPLIVAYVREKSAVSACKTSGGSYNYALKVCDAAGAAHPYIPFGNRHMGLMGITLMVLLALAISRYVKWRRRLQ